MKPALRLTIAVFSLTVIESCADPMMELFVKRGFSPENIVLPEPGEKFPTEKLVDPEVVKVVDIDWFPEGPSYRAADDTYFFAGNRALTRVDPDGSLHKMMGGPGAGGTHVLPDGSILVLGGSGLRRLMPDGTIALIADGAKTGQGNDITVGVYNEIYYSAPRVGIFRVTPGKDGKVEKVSENWANGLDVDPSGKFLYVNRGGVRRYAINGVDQPLGEETLVYRLADDERGGLDGCTFDAWGNFYKIIFTSGTVLVIDPDSGTRLGKFELGVAPSTNLTFGGPSNTDLLVTAGVPRLKNMQILKVPLGITGFPGHPGATEYPVLRILEE